MKYANYANYLIKYAFYRETPGLIEFYRKNDIRLNLGILTHPVIKYLQDFLCLFVESLITATIVLRYLVSTLESGYVDHRY